MSTTKTDVAFNCPAPVEVSPVAVEESSWDQKAFATEALKYF
jgi:hypothetical protein